MPRLTPFLALFLVVGGLGGWAQPADMPLTEATQVRSLPRAQATRGLPVRLTGVVTFSNNANGFVLDDGSGIWVNLRGRNMERPSPGDRVAIEGRTGEGHFAPVVQARKLTRLGTAALPPPEEITGPEMRSGELDCRRVRLRGVVRGRMPVQSGDAHVSALVLATAHGLIPFQFFGTNGELGTEWEDAEVEATGVCRMIFNARGQPQGVRLTGNALDDIRVTRAAQGDAFSAPAIALDEVLRFSPDGLVLHRRRVTGTVTLSKPGKFFYLQEGPHALRVNTRQAGDLMPGDVVEAAGFLDIIHNKARLEEGVFRRLGTGTPPAAVEISMDQALRPSQFPPAGEYPDFDDRLIAVRGRLLTVEDRRHEGWRLNLESDGVLIPVEFSPDADLGALEALAPGSELRVRGICALTFSESAPVLAWPRPTGLRVLARDATDIDVVKQAPWWTSGRLWTALAVTSAVLLSAALWILLLRRTVARRGQQLADEMQARHVAAVEFESTLRERTRLAADLHDTLEQSLTGLALQLEAGEALLDLRLDRSRHHLRLGQQLLSRSREDLRRSIWNLRSTALEEGSLQQALQKVAVNRANGVEVQIAVQCKGTARPVPDMVAGNLLLLTQEAITNTLKHASARGITLTLSFAEKNLSLGIRDDGVGFELAEVAGPSSGHFGLQGMRERIKRLGGTIEITSARQCGTLIHVVVPC